MNSWRINRRQIPTFLGEIILLALWCEILWRRWIYGQVPGPIPVFGILVLGSASLWWIWTGEIGNLLRRIISKK